MAPLLVGTPTISKYPFSNPMGKFYIGHVSYNGDGYYGWQKQKDLPTIQETIFTALRETYPFGRIDVKATSRTDRGVNAFAQVVKFLAPRKEEPADVLKKLNEQLPRDIVFTQLERIHKSFKISYLPLYKEYVYFFSLNKLEAGLPFVGHYNGNQPLDLELMQAACREFVGVKNFKDFQYRSDVKSDFKREIFEAKIVPANELFPHFTDSEGVFCFYVKGRGFLKQMVRLMVGGLFMCGSSSEAIERLKEALNGEGMEKLTGDKVSFIAPPQGLFLYHIEFPEVSVNEDRRKVVDQRKFLDLFPDLELWRREGASFPIDLPKSND